MSQNQFSLGMGNNSWDNCNDQQQWQQYNQQAATQQGQPTVQSGALPSNG